MRRPLIGGTTLTLAMLVLAATTGGAASSAVDTTPPVLNTPVKSSWIVGSQLSTDFIPDCATGWQPGTGQVWVSVNQTFKWTGSDNSGTVNYSFVENTTGAGSVDWGELGTTRSLTRHTTNANQGCGGGSDFTSDWDITARDPSGNSVTKNVRGGVFTFTQNNNTYDDSYYAVRSIITYGGTWATAKCTCWSDGSVAKTITKNSSATITFQQGTGTSPTHAGLVMHKGPDRGKFQVYVNGVLKNTVDLYAAVSKPRVVVWQASVKTTDVIKIVNLATLGRQRIDLDGVLTN